MHLGSEYGRVTLLSQLHYPSSLPSLHPLPSTPISRVGKASFDSTVPDTITSWVGEAIALHRSTGLGISPQTQLTVSKPFFVSLELPFSVNFGEMVTVIPLVFNFGGKSNAGIKVCIEVCMYIILGTCTW